jgi:nucleosome assembly protein 1-like 1
MNPNMLSAAGLKDLVEQQENNDNIAIMADFKKLLPTVPLQQRGKALALYNIMKNWCKADDASDVICENHMEEFSKAELLITADSDAIIEGARPCTESELEATKDFLGEDEQIKPEDNDGKPIDAYWLTCFKNKKLPVEEHDEPLLKNLYKLDVIEKADEAKPDAETAPEVEAQAQPVLPDGIHPEAEAKKTETSDEPVDKKPKKAKILDVKFHFLENEWFENKILSLIIHFEGEDPIKSVSDKIVWKEGKNVTEKNVSKKQKSKKTGKTRTIESKKKCESFFNIFADFTADDVDFGQDQEKEDEVSKNLYDVVDMIDEIMDMAPYSLEYYMDLHPEEDEDDMDDDEDEDDDDEDDEEVDLFFFEFCLNWIVGG